MDENKLNFYKQEKAKLTEKELGEIQSSETKRAEFKAFLDTKYANLQQTPESVTSAKPAGIVSSALGSLAKGLGSLGQKAPGADPISGAVRLGGKVSSSLGDYLKSDSVTYDDSVEPIDDAFLRFRAQGQLVDSPESVEHENQSYFRKRGFELLPEKGGDDRWFARRIKDGKLFVVDKAGMELGDITTDAFTPVAQEAGQLYGTLKGMLGGSALGTMALPGPGTIAGAVTGAVSGGAAGRIATDQALAKVGNRVAPELSQSGIEGGIGGLIDAASGGASKAALAPVRQKAILSHESLLKKFLKPELKSAAKKQPGLNTAERFLDYASRISEAKKVAFELETGVDARKIISDQIDRGILTGMDSKTFDFVSRQAKRQGKTLSDFPGLKAWAETGVESLNDLQNIIRYTLGTGEGSGKGIADIVYNTARTKLDELPPVYKASDILDAIDSVKLHKHSYIQGRPKEVESSLLEYKRQALDEMKDFAERKFPSYKAKVDSLNSLNYQIKELVQEGTDESVAAAYEKSLVRNRLKAEVENPPVPFSWLNVKRKALKGKFPEGDDLGPIIEAAKGKALTSLENANLQKIAASGEGEVKQLAADVLEMNDLYRTFGAFSDSQLAAGYSSDLVSIKRDKNFFKRLNELRRGNLLSPGSGDMTVARRDVQASYDMASALAKLKAGLPITRDDVTRVGANQGLMEWGYAPFRRSASFLRDHADQFEKVLHRYFQLQNVPVPPQIIETIKTVREGTDTEIQESVGGMLGAGIGQELFEPGKDNIASEMDGAANTVADRARIAERIEREVESVTEKATKLSILNRTGRYVVDDANLEAQAR